MFRDINRVIADYHKQFGAQACKFYAPDIDQIRDIALRSSSKSQNEVLWAAISTALEAGFMIGYKAGKREVRRKRA